MRMVDLILKKRNGEHLTEEEIHYIIDGYTNKKIPDYQISSFLMAVYFQGMSEEEQLAFTNAMLNSGEKVDLSKIKGVTCDKHSTGGVGDKTSLVVIPLASACGVKMAKMSGRGLGHTGGTLDKLESIPGFKIELSADEFFDQVNAIGLSIIGQTANIAPADKLLYALRDVTGTIESIPLIASSIMSKKIASGADTIVLDVKVGEGAFMKDLKSAETLAKAMVKIGTLAKRKTVATLTDMSEPLGDAVGNAVEIREAIETLKGNGPKDFTELCISFVKEILVLCGICKNDSEAEKMTLEAINNRSGLEKFRQMVKWQHGDERVCDDYELLHISKVTIPVIYHGEPKYVEKLNALDIGEAAMLLGAGRETKEESIDLSVGIVLNKKVGDLVKDNDVLATLYTNNKNIDLAKEKVIEAYKFSKQKVERINKILEIVR